MGRKVVSICMVIIVLFSMFVVIDLSFDFTPRVGATTWYVDDVPGGSPPEDFTTIQAAIDAASDGDTVYVYNGDYYETIVVNKRLSLIGQNKVNTMINGEFEFNPTVHITRDYVSISGFNIIGGDTGPGGGVKISSSSYVYVSGNEFRGNAESIYLDYSDHCIIDNNFIELDGYAVFADSSNWNYIANNTISQIGCGIRLDQSNNNLIFNNNFNDVDYGIWIIKSSSNTVLDNDFVMGSTKGIYMWESPGNILVHNTITNFPMGIDLSYSSSCEISKNTINSNEIGINTEYSLDCDYFNNDINGNTNIGMKFYQSRNNVIYNGSILDSGNYDIYLESNSNIVLLNSSINKTNCHIIDSASILYVKWYLHISVNDVFSQPIQNALICMKDSMNTLPVQRYRTNSNGEVKWLTELEYREKNNGKTFYTPHKITAWNETLMGYAEVNMNESKEVNVVLDTPYHEIPVYKGWNLVSLPLVQPDTSISTVLGSIAGNYDKVEWFNTSEGIWHTTDDDLTDINHTMGFWIHMKTDDTLIITGNIPNKTSIQLYQGWNLIGNPSFCIHGFDEIFASISGNYTAVQWYDAGDKGDPWKHYNNNKPQEMNDLRYITSGRGYWIYVDQDCVWEVNNFK